MGLLIVILDRGHVGKPDLLGDVGATDVGHGLYEAILTRDYLAPCEDRLRELDHPDDPICVYPMSDGAYSARHARAVRLAHDWHQARVLYLQAHVNAGGGQKGLVFHDRRSPKGKAAAGIVAAHLETGLQPFAVGYECRVQAAHPDDWTKRAYACLRGIYPGPANICGILIEPAAIDQPGHRSILGIGGLEAVGRSLADGIVAWHRAEAAEVAATWSPPS